MSAALAINSGFSLDTAFPDPINSGGSIAIKSGLSLTYFLTSAISFTQTIEIIFNSFNFKTNFSISLFDILCSLWLISDPFTLDFFNNSGITKPVVLPIFESSTC